LACFHSDPFCQFVTDDWAVAMDLDSLRSSHPIQVHVASADQVSEIFDAISYYKGASVIRSVYDWIGEGAFQAGLQAYLAKFAFSNTVRFGGAACAMRSAVVEAGAIRGRCVSSRSERCLDPRP
jgi:hypothetical protein